MAGKGGTGWVAAVLLVQYVEDGAPFCPCITK